MRMTAVIRGGVPWFPCLALIGGPGTRSIVMVDWVCLKLNYVNVNVNVNVNGKSTFCM
jgi:hypothetical protein